MSFNLQFWRLIDPGSIDGQVIYGVHNHWLCALAVLIAIFAAGILLPVTDRYHEGDPRYRLLWLCSGSLAMGTGIWAMHFTAMLAYRLPITATYDVIITLLSIPPAVLASAYCIINCRPSKIGNSLLNLRLQLSAISMAGGIGFMHYLGMEAMNLPADMYYSPGLFLLSLLAAYVLGLVGLHIYCFASTSSAISPRIAIVVSSVVVGVAVSSMHFIAMEATFFVPNMQILPSELAIEPFGLIAVIIIVACFLIGLMILGSVIDHRFAQVSLSLQQSEQRFLQLAESAQAAIFTFNKKYVLYTNPALSMITGLSREQITKTPLTGLFGESFARLAESILTPPFLFDKPFHEEFRITLPSGEECWIYLSVTVIEFDGQHIGLASGFDITEKKAAEYSLRELAYYDQLTRLANRTMFIDRLDHHLKLIRRESNEINSCVMLLDLDGFKAVNDSLGHQAGDELLVLIARRLQLVARDSDTLARLGGDEFVMLFENISDQLNWTLIADKLLAIFAEPMDIRGKKIDVGGSVGILPLNPARYETADEVLRDVDIALYRAKHASKSHWVIFDDQLDAASRRLRVLQGELIDAIQGDQLQLFYQPILEAKTRRVVGFEALSRWQRKNSEWVSPAEFIPLAERAGLISEISLWAMRTAAEQIASWRRQGRNDVYISVNVAAISFNDDAFFAELEQLVAQHSIAPGQLRLELTESMLMKNADVMVGRFQVLQEMGFELMLDDFGTGYSSLSSLSHLPIETLKIDKSFIAELNLREQSASVVSTVISLANHLGMRVISEGVETEAQAFELERLGSHYLQGYLFARPMPAVEASQLLQSG